MTLLEVEILLHYHYSTDEPLHIFTPAGKEAFAKFVAAGILAEREDGTHYPIMNALDLYVKAVCDIPLPTRIWTISQSQQQ